MISSSMAYKEAIKKNRVMSIRDSYIFADGSRPDMSTTDFMSYSINEAVSNSTSFSIGSAIIKKYKATLNNMNGKFDSYDFDGLDILARIGLQLADGSTEIIQKGRYRCANAKINENTIDLEAYDSMLFFDRPYSDSTLKYPATINGIISDACLNCQMTYDASTVSLGGYVVEQRPNDKNLTFRDVIGYCAQIMCCYAKIDHLDKLSFGWYDFSTLEKLQAGYEGGNLKNYSSGDVLEGGNFEDYSSGDNADGSTFEELHLFHHFYSLGSQSINTDDITITGINVDIQAEGKSEKESYQHGNTGYVLSIEKNPLIESGKAEAVARYIGKIMTGKKFRPLSITCQSDPCIEAGDCACVTDRKRRTYFTVITDTTFAMGAMQSVTCAAETPTEKNYVKYSTVTKVLNEADKNTEKKLSAYDIAVQHLTSLITQSLGVFKSEEVLEDGSVIYYMHDKPKMEESKTIWKMTADVLAVSTDGGKTWNAGIDSEGNAVVNVLNAIGINADWINAGEISSVTINIGNGKFTVDASGTGRFEGDIHANSLTLGTDVTVSYDKISDPPQIPSVSSTLADGIVRTIITVGDQSYTTYTSQDGSYILTNLGIGTDTADASESFFKVNTDGLLTAKNALIYGTIYATNGKFSGEIIANAGRIGGFYIDKGALLCGLPDDPQAPGGISSTSEGVELWGKNTKISSRDYTEITGNVHMSDTLYSPFIQIGGEESGNQRGWLDLYGDTGEIKGSIYAASIEDAVDGLWLESRNKAPVNIKASGTEILLYDNTKAYKDLAVLGDFSVSGAVSVPAIRIGENETDAYGWVDIYYQGSLHGSIYADADGLRVIARTGNLNLQCEDTIHIWNDVIYHGSLNSAAPQNLRVATSDNYTNQITAMFEKINKQEKRISELETAVQELRKER